jgi:hypothetical protein
MVASIPVFLLPSQAGVVGQFGLAAGAAAKDATMDTEVATLESGDNADACEQRRDPLPKLLVEEAMDAARSRILHMVERALADHVRSYHDG